MASKKQIKQRNKFKKATKKCHKSSSSPKGYGSCMKKELKK